MYSLMWNSKAVLYNLICINYGIGPQRPHNCYQYSFLCLAWSPITCFLQACSSALSLMGICFFSAALLHMPLRSFPAQSLPSLMEVPGRFIFVRVWLFIVPLGFWTNIHHYISYKVFMQCLLLISIQIGILLNLGSTKQAKSNIT